MGILTDISDFFQKHRTFAIFLIVLIPLFAVFNSWLIWETIQHFRSHIYVENEVNSGTKPPKHQILSNSQLHKYYELTYNSESPYTANWIEQPFDHFDASENRTFQQRFYANAEYYELGGPIFLYLTGEWTANFHNIKDETRPMVQFAKKHKAMIYLLEHRYYGSSIVVDSTKTAADMKWLSTDQALADCVLFIRQMNRDFPKFWHSKWIAFGGSYAGSLATWLRLKYPDYVFGAIGSSSALEAMSGYPDYRKIVAKDMDLKVHNCSRTVSKAVRAIQKLMLTEEGRETLNRKFELYHEPLTGTYNAGYFVQALLQKLNLLSQFNIPLLNERCHQFVHSNKSIIDAYMEVFVSKDFYHDVYDFDGGIDRWNGWTWMLCNELGLFTTTDTTQRIFGNTLTIDYFIQRCIKIDPFFTRQKLDQNVRQTNDFYGGGKNFTGSRVIEVYGSLDPWKESGLIPSKENIENDVIRIEIDGTTHCEDMKNPLNGTNPEALQKAQNQVGIYLDKWIKMDRY